MAKAPIYLRELTADERAVLQAGLHSRDVFVLRRCQILLASVRGERASQIATELGCDTDTALNAINAFNRTGLAALTPACSVAHTIYRAFDVAQAEQLKALLHQSPRTFGKETSLWTLELAAEVSFEQGVTPERVSREAVRTALQRLGVRWQRAKHWITSPDPAYARKKADRDRLIALAEDHPEYVLGFQDEVWWSRIAQPHLHAWAAEDAALRLGEKVVAKDDPDPKALACYGLLLSCPGAPATLPEQVWLRFVKDRPISAVTTQYLAWSCDKLAQLGKKALLMIWDNASWHLSHEVRDWLRAHNQEVRQTGQGVRIIACYLPTKSPWLNRIEPHWMHGKRKIVEPARLLTAHELAERVCGHFGCEHESHLAVTEKAA